MLFAATGVQKWCWVVAISAAFAFAGPVAGAGKAANVFKAPLSAEAKPALQQSLSVLTNSQLTLGSFKQTRTIKKLNREFVSTGSFAIDRDAGILWDTQKPFASVMLVGDNSIVQWDAARDVKKTMSAKDNPVFAEFSKTIQSVFSGKFDELERNFKIYFEKKGDVFSIGLVPKEKAVANVIGSIVLEGRSELEKVTIVDGEENPVVYEFTQHRHFANLESVDTSLADLARKFQKLK